MDHTTYELTDSVAGFDEGDVLDVTARFGDWHTYDLKLEPQPPALTSPTVVVTDDPGFSEAEILDETARFGDWHRYRLQFDPGRSGEEIPTAGRVQFTKEEFERVAEPVSPTV